MGKHNKTPWQRIFHRAFDKAAWTLPGQANPLTEEENRVLLEAIAGYRTRQTAALERFLAYLQKQGREIPYLEAKLIFKELCFEGRIVF